MCDDGPGNWHQALELAKRASAQGITTIVATPHHRKGNYYNGAGQIAYLVQRMNERLREAGIPIHVVPGQEYHLTSALRDDYASQELQTIGHTRYLLIELSSRLSPRNLQASIRFLKDMNILPVIVHPERFAPFIENPSHIYKLVNEGVYMQLTAGSLVGQFGSDVQRTARLIAVRNWAHLLASDAHDLSKRGFRLREGFQLLEEWCGTETADRFKRNAMLAVNGKSLIAGVPANPHPKRRWLQFFSV